MGVDNLDIDAATTAGVTVCNVPDYCQDEVSTHAMALLLDLVRKVTLLHNDCTRGGWNFAAAASVPRTAGKTLGLLGFVLMMPFMVKYINRLIIVMAEQLILLAQAIK